VGYGEVLGDKSTVCIRVTFITFFKYSSGFIVYCCMHGCMFFMFLFNFVNYLLLLLLYIIIVMECIFIIMLYVLLLA
jgi:hypothetical protein